MFRAKQKCFGYLFKLRDITKLQAYGDGTGKLATVNGTQTGTTITFDDVIYLKPGMVVDTYDSTGTTRDEDSVTINSIDRVNNQATFATSISVTDNDIVVREETKVSAPSDGKEIAGLKLIIDDGTVATTFQSLSRSTYPILRGNVINAGSVNLTNDLLQRAADEASIIGDGRIDMLISRHGQRRKYLDLTTPDKRFLDNKLDRGYQKISWNNLDWLNKYSHLN